MKRKHTLQPVRKHPVSLDIAYVRWPEHLAAWILPTSFLQKIEDIVTYGYQNLHQLHWPPLCGNGFFDYEMNRMERLYYVVRDEMNNIDNRKRSLLRKQFAEYVIEYDRRRGTNFLETFPEYKEFFDECKIFLNDKDNTFLRGE